MSGNNGGAPTFEGFSPQTIRFLEELRDHNTKSWFEENRERYRRELLGPMLDLVGVLSGTMLSIDPKIEVTPGVGKTLSRINRDIRFSPNKAPYRDRMWITFKRPEKDWQDAPAYFFELMTEGYRFGMGYYDVSRDTMEMLRADMRERPRIFAAATEWLNDQDIFALEGEEYKRRRPETPPEFADWYNRKYFFLCCNRPIEERLFASTLAEDLAAAFALGIPLYRYLHQVRDALKARRTMEAAFPDFHG